MGSKSEGEGEEMLMDDEDDGEDCGEGEETTVKVIMKVKME